MTIPSGWYFCEESKNIAATHVVRKELFGQVIVLWRTQSGVLHISDATCPHMGSDLGKLGRVQGEHLKCFSHDYTFDGAGNCVKTHFKTPPCRTQNVLYSWPVHEIGGFVMVWYDAHRAQPPWSIPESIFDTTHKGPFVRSQFTFDVSVDILNQDNFDVGHLYKWHELKNVVSSKATCDGPTISVVHDFTRHSIFFQKPLPGLLKILSQEITSRYGSTLYGHGLTYSYIDLQKFDFHVQDFIFATPISSHRTLYTTFLRRILPDPHKKESLQKRILNAAFHPILFRLFLRRLRKEHLTEGHGYWENRSHVSNPILTNEERTLIDPYQKWCRQFVME